MSAQVRSDGIIRSSFLGKLLSRTDNLKALTIGQLRAEEKTLRILRNTTERTILKFNLFKITKSSAKARGNVSIQQRSLRIIEARLALVIREIQNKGEQQKLIGDIRDLRVSPTPTQAQIQENLESNRAQAIRRETDPIERLRQQRIIDKELLQVRSAPEQVTTSTSQFVLGSTTGAVSSIVQSNNLGILFTDLPRNNFIVRVDDNTRQRLGQEAQRDGRWSTSFKGAQNRPATSTFEQVIRIIDETLRQFPDPKPDQCEPGFHRDPITFQCIPNEEEEDTGRNLFQSAIIGVLALGAIGGSFLNDKSKRRKR